MMTAEKAGFRITLILPPASSPDRR
jgi:hypothetical protein